MTNENAIKMIKDDMRLHHDYLSGKYRKALKMAIEALHSCSEKPNNSESNSQNQTDSLIRTSADAVSEADVIYRRDAIDALDKRFDDVPMELTTEILQLRRDLRERLPSAQPERLTDDDFETIRIHLSAHKEELCNQYRWEEAEEYQRIIDRFMAFASEKPEIITCKDCVHNFEGLFRCDRVTFFNEKDDFCSKAKMKMRGKENETD